MGKSENDLAEETAADLARLILHDSTSIEIDMPNNTDDVDYKLFLDGTLQAVGEVKRDIDRDLMSYDNLQKNGKFSFLMDLPDGKGRWAVHLDPILKRTKIKDQLYLDLINFAINEGIYTWEIGLNEPLPSDEFQSLINRLGISRLYLLSPYGPSYLLRYRDMRSGSFLHTPLGVDDWLNAVIGAHSQKPSYERFVDYGAPESHIFIIMGSATPQDIFFWASMGPPTAFEVAVKLPTVTTHLFVSSNTYAQVGERRIWLYQPGLGWSFHQI